MLAAWPHVIFASFVIADAVMIAASAAPRDQCQAFGLVDLVKHRRPDRRVSPRDRNRHCRSSPIQLWNVANPAHPLSLGQALHSGSGPVNSLAFSPHGRMMTNGSNDGTIQLWNAADPTNPHGTRPEVP